MGNEVEHVCPIRYFCTNPVYVNTKLFLTYSKLLLLHNTQLHFFFYKIQ